MELSSEEVGVIAKELGLDFGKIKFVKLDPDMLAAMQAARESGQSPPADLPGFYSTDYLRPRIVGGLNSDQQVGNNAARAEIHRNTNGTSLVFLDNLIEYL